MATETVWAPRDGSPNGDAGRWLPGRNRPRPGERRGIGTRARRWQPSGHRRGRTGAGGRSPRPAAATPSRRSSGSRVATPCERRSGSHAPTPSGRSWRSTEAPPSGRSPRERTSASGPSRRRGAVVPSRRSGSFRITAGASGRGERSATSSAIWRLDRWAARIRRASRFSRVRCGPSFAMAVRCSRPSASMVRRRGCSRAARAAAIRR
jgi:hypothetical protein